MLINKGKYIPYNPNLKDNSRNLRKVLTPSEKKIWKEFFQKIDLIVYRQRIIDNFIVDFYIPKIKLVIEIDGKIHEKLKEYDKERAEKLRSYGLKIVRITNESILNNSEKTYKKLSEIIDKEFDKYSTPPF
ncbi:MAG: endonuclease domain-containing protein [Candidatus Nomurabacteria bacterium]